MTRDEAIAAGMAVYWDCEHKSEAEARVAFVASLAASGFAVVPVEPTQKMLDAGYGAIDAAVDNGEIWSVENVYDVMLAAAQEDSRD